MLPAGGASNLFYNKPLLRLLEFALFLALGAAGYIYLAQSLAKLETQGLLDALAVYSFIIAAFLVILIAEVADSHYLRALGALATVVGMAAGFRFIFIMDAPHLEATPMALALVAFIIAFALAAFYLFIIVGRLVMDKVQAHKVAAVRDGRGPAPAPREPTPKAQPSAQAPATESKPGELALIGVGGPYLGRRFPLKKGENRVGRVEGDIILADDQQISRNHCVVTWGDDAVRITDAGSTNGTFVQGARIAESTVAPGDIIGVGASTFKLG
jgi:hypothetical protein